MPPLQAIWFLGGHEAHYQEVQRSFSLQDKQTAWLNAAAFREAFMQHWSGWSPTARLAGQHLLARLHLHAV